MAQNCGGVWEIDLETREREPSNLNGVIGWAGGDEEKRRVSPNRLRRCFYEIQTQWLTRRLLLFVTSLNVAPRSTLKKARSPAERATLPPSGAYSFFAFV